MDTEIQSADFVKLDVEGMEPQVLQGSVNLIARSKPTFIFEVNMTFLKQQNSSIFDLQKFFASHGYWLWYPFSYGKDLGIGAVPHILIAALLINPGCLLLGKKSYNFDLLALPCGKMPPGEFKVFSVLRLVCYLLILNVKDKVLRMRKALGL